MQTVLYLFILPSLLSPLIKGKQKNLKQKSWTNKYLRIFPVDSLEKQHLLQV